MNTTASLSDDQHSNFPEIYRFSNIFRLWPVLHALSLLAIVLQPTTPAVVLGRYSKTSIVIGLIVLILLPVSLVIYRWFGNKIDKNMYTPATPPLR